ncbi:hypothetical protein BTJ68_03450 [Hortaea werneckii EXF-2000]|uniref:Uncharacterized protein n=1 Tax=Hortaea werneckii EXF-2000 TaxID=1157616 RepID=A0A1Z5TK87_HORWE|nr:hypothetical protein BTJ68_03450 [Hortaea werneckii EXF-2000]
MDHPGGHGTRAENDALSKSKVAIKFLVDPKTGPPAHPSPDQDHLLAELEIRYKSSYSGVWCDTQNMLPSEQLSLPGAAFLLAPTGILGGAGVGLLWAIGRFGWRRARARMDRRHHDESGDPRKDEQEDAHEGAVEQERAIRLPRAEPW